MGKPTGFMEYDRCEAASVEPKERIKNFNEFHVFLSKEISRNRLPVVWTAEFLSASRE